MEQVLSQKFGRVQAQFFGMLAQVCQQAAPLFAPPHFENTLLKQQNRTHTEK
jgi:hypothetical protein